MEAEYQSRELLALLDRIDRAGEVDLLVDLAAAGRDLCAAWVMADLGGSWLARLLSEMNDRIAGRAISLAAARHPLPAVSWCWLALGSEGRHEQTFCTDQDNGLIFSAADPSEADALRELFLPFAQAVNGDLDRCGLMLCSGGVMAGNPKWCLSLDEWQWQFSEWIRRPEPQALLHATIFFDFRSLWGDVELSRQLRRYLLGLTRDTPAFLHLMAANALDVQPPLGFLGDVKAAGDDGGCVDLKKFGIRLFVDVARILALAHGVEQVGTASRLGAAASGAGMQPREAAAAVSALSHLQRLRLSSQVGVLAAGGTPSHRLDPEGLNELDQAILRESLKQARKLQQRLRLNYSL